MFIILHLTGYPADRWIEGQIDAKVTAFFALPFMAMEVTYLVYKPNIS